MPRVFRPSLTKRGLSYSRRAKKVTERVWVNLFTHTYVGLLGHTLTKYSNYVTGTYFIKSVRVIIALLLTVSVF